MRFLSNKAVTVESKLVHKALMPVKDEYLLFMDFFLQIAMTGCRVNISIDIYLVLFNRSTTECI